MKYQSSINALIFIIIGIVVLIIAIILILGLYHYGYNGMFGLNKALNKTNQKLNTS